MDAHEWSGGPGPQIDGRVIARVVACDIQVTGSSRAGSGTSRCASPSMPGAGDLAAGIEWRQAPGPGLPRVSSRSVMTAFVHG